NRASTAVSLEDLEVMIGASRPHVMLFADLVRPQGSGSRINSAFENQFGENRKLLRGVLANESRPCAQDPAISEFGCALQRLLEQGLKTSGSSLGFQTICRQGGSALCVGSADEVALSKSGVSRRRSWARPGYPTLLAAAYYPAAPDDDVKPSKEVADL